MTAALDRLTASLATNASATASAIALITTIAGEIRSNVDDSDALNALADKLDTENAAIAAAVTANTPASGDASITPGGDAPTPIPVTNPDGSVSTGQAPPATDPAGATPIGTTGDDTAATPPATDPASATDAETPPAS